MYNILTKNLQNFVLSIPQHSTVIVTYFIAVCFQEILETSPLR